MNEQDGRRLPDARVDEAIDRAVQRMMQAEPAPGLRERVQATLARPERRPWVMWPGLAGAAAVAAAVLLAVIYGQPARGPAGGPVPAAVVAEAPAASQSPTVATEPSEAAPADPPAASSRPTQEPAPPRVEPLPAPPRMDAVFGAPPGRVGAASLPAATTPDFEPLPDIEPLPGSSQETASTTAQLLNVRVELTLIEEGDGAGAPKRVSMLLADQQQGRLRSSGAAPASHLNVDARPEVASDGRIRLFLSLDYRRDNTGTGLTQSLHTLLDNGKPLQVSQSPDPKSERAVRLEVTATIVK